MSRSPVSAAEGSLGSGTKCAAFEKWSTKVNITVWPLEDASLVMKSMAIWDQGCRRIGSGFRRSPGWCEDFPCAHTGQAVTKALVSRAMDGRQKHCCGRCSVRLSPGLHGSLDVCPHCRTLEQAESGTNRVWEACHPGQAWSAAPRGPTPPPARWRRPRHRRRGDGLGLRVGLVCSKLA